LKITIVIVYNVKDVVYSQLTLYDVKDIITDNHDNVDNNIDVVIFDIIM